MVLYQARFLSINFIVTLDPECHPLYALFQLMAIPYMLKICLWMQHLLNLKRSSGNLVLSSLMAYKLEATRFFSVSCPLKPNFNIPTIFFLIFSTLRRMFLNYLQLQGFCFGFVEFEVANAAQSAIEVNLSSISILFICCMLLELL